MYALKCIATGLFIGFVVGLIANSMFWIAVAILIAIVILIGCADWSGQGDGREGCNRHTSCNH